MNPVMGDREDRRDARYRVHLQVRYGVAKDFVVEYAENLSKGGLFIAGAQALAPLQEVTVEIELPGYGRFRVVGEIAHVMDAETAERFGRTAGAGLAITKAPEGFDEALGSYLHRLGSRADHLVLVGDEAYGPPLRDAGYQVEPAPAPEAVAALIARSDIGVIGLVVPRAAVERYAAAAAAAGAGDIVIGVDEPPAMEKVLLRLDAEL
jgi:Tfp pilus assembly protein PilZ